MIDLPKGWPQYQLDLRQEMHRLRIQDVLPPPLPEDSRHNALDDARWLRDACKKMLGH